MIVCNFAAAFPISIETTTTTKNQIAIQCDGLNLISRFFTALPKRNFKTFLIGYIFQIFWDTVSPKFRNFLNFSKAFSFFQHFVHLQFCFFFLLMSQATFFVVKIISTIFTNIFNFFVHSFSPFGRITALYS